VAVIGAGRVGTAFAVLLERAGYRVASASGSDSTSDRVRRFLPFTRFWPGPEAAHAAQEGDVVILGVPDDQIEPLCTHLAQEGAFRTGQTVVHLSGSRGLDVLRSALDAGAGVLSLHPLQSFPDVTTGIERLPGSAIAVTASSAEAVALGEALARDVGGIPFALSDEDRPLYHAAAVFAANYLVAVEAVAERLFQGAGLDKPLPMFSPLARAALDSALERGPHEALTGPAVRGDLGTIARNLEALARRAPETV
jgi:predicted short-subunit dehydrogenase-like oxidoreductase (DUF2520 family)